MKPLKGQSITPAATLGALKPIQSNGGYGATYEVFTAAIVRWFDGIGTPGASANDAGILVRLTKDTIGPPYLIIGPEMAVATSNISRMELNLRVVDQNFGGSDLSFAAQPKSATRQTSLPSTIVC